MDIDERLERLRQSIQQSAIENEELDEQLAQISEDTARLLANVKRQASISASRAVANRITIQLTIERDLAAGDHKSGRFRCKLSAGGRKLFMSAVNAGSVAAAKRHAEELFDEAIAWSDVDDPVVRARAELEL